MSQRKDRRIPPKEAASQADVARAIESLSASDLVRLKDFGYFLVRGLGRAAQGRNSQELLQEALRATVEGAEGGTQGRRWDKGRVSFIEHLFGAMRSIASHWDTAFDTEEWSDSDAAHLNEQGKLVRPVENAVSFAPDALRAYTAKEELALIDKMFETDEDAQFVLEGWKEGMTGPEIIAQLGLSENRFNAAVRRIRYKLKEK